MKSSKPSKPNKTKSSKSSKPKKTKSSKLSTTNESQNINGIDKLSAIPDELIHHIFSFLDMKVVVQTSILSKRWRYLWKYTPVLNFFLKDMDFIHLVDQVLHLTKICNIQKLMISCVDQLPKSLIDAWLDIALLRHVQVFHLISDPYPESVLPDYLFTSDIKELKVHSLGLHIYHLPSSACTAVSIKSLDLARVRLPATKTNEELVLSCPNLENLSLNLCFTDHLKVFTISAPLLKSFEFKGCPDRDVKLVVCTPSLTSIKFRGFMDLDYCFENLSSLVSADFFLWGLGPEVEVKEVSVQCLVKLFRELCNVKALKLSFQILEILAVSPDLIELLPFLLQNLRCVKMVYMENYYWICTSAKVVQRFPYLETLVLECHKSYMGISAVSQKDFSFQCTFYSLKTVEIRNFDGHKVLLKYFEFLLKGAIVLEEVMITSSRVSRDLLMKFVKKLLTLPRASSGVTVSLPFNN